MDMQLASYATSIDHNVLELFIDRQYIKHDSVAEVTEADLIECINRRCERPKGAFELSDVEKAIKTVCIRMSIPGAEPRIDSLVLDYKRALEASGYSNLPKECPKIAIKHIFDRLRSTILRGMMEDEFENQNSKGLHKKCFRYFIAELARLAEIVEKTNSRRSVSSGKKISASQKGVVSRNPKARKSALEASRSEASLRTERATNAQKEPRLSVYMQSARQMASGISSRNSHLSKTTTPLATTSLPNGAKSMVDHPKLKHHGGMRSMGGPQVDNHTTLFSNKFHKSLEVMVLADNCADDNLMPLDVFEKLKSINSTLKVKRLDTPLEYALAVHHPGHEEFAKVVCDRTVTADVELRIRHRTTLFFRNVEWAISKQPAQHVLIGRPLLEALGLDTKTILEAASDRHNGIVNVPDILLTQIEPQKGTLAKFIREGIYHHQHADDGYVSDEDIYIDLGEDMPGEVELALQKKVTEAKANNLSSEGVTELQALLREFTEIFRVRLGKTAPAKVPPMRVKLKTGARPVIAKARRYSADQRMFLEKYIDELETMGFVRKNEESQWASAPLLVPKMPKGRFRMTVDLRAGNAATESVCWPMRHVDSEVYDFAGSNSFATVDFVSGYWQLPLHAELQSIHSIVTSKWSYSPTRTQQGAVNSVANFQSGVEPLFRSMRKNAKAWLDDFLLHCKGEKSLLEKLPQFFCCAGSTDFTCQPRNACSSLN